ncbi:MAG: plasmid stabilization protein [Sulfuricaulis sp.]
MPRGDKSSYTNRQKRQVEHIEDSYEKRGVPVREAERRAWATINKNDGGGKKAGSGRGKHRNARSLKKDGEHGGTVSATRSRAARSASTRRAAHTHQHHVSR